MRLDRILKYSGGVLMIGVWSLYKGAMGTMMTLLGSDKNKKYEIEEIIVLTQTLTCSHAFTSTLLYMFSLIADQFMHEDLSDNWKELITNSMDYPYLDIIALILASSALYTLEEELPTSELEIMVGLEGFWCINYLLLILISYLNRPSNSPISSTRLVQNRITITENSADTSEEKSSLLSLNNRYKATRLSEDDIPRSLTDCIHLTLMEEPVILTGCGHSLDAKSAVKCDKCPICRTPITSKELISNVNLKQVAHEFVAAAELNKVAGFFKSKIESKDCPEITINIQSDEDISNERLKIQ